MNAPRIIAATIIAALAALIVLPAPTITPVAGYLPATPTPIVIDNYHSRFQAGAIYAQAPTNLASYLIGNAIQRWPLTKNAPEETTDAVETLTQRPAKFPHTITTAHSTSGTSIGLAAALGALDKSSPGYLTTNIVTATGVIAADGTVSPVAGAAAKAVGAAHAGHQLIIVPADNAWEAWNSGANIDVIGVTDVWDAVAKLCQLGSDDALCRDLPPAR